MKNLPKSYNHHITRDGSAYVLHWCVDRMSHGRVRIQHPRDYRRRTDRAGALRFMSKWGLDMLWDRVSERAAATRKDGE